MDELRGIWRGKRINNKERNGEWVEGFLYPVKYTGFDFSGGTDYYIDTYPTGAGRQHTQVDPSTLGECTGLRDKNGKPIFEGDICKDENSTYLIVWHMRQWQCEVIHSNCVLVLDCSFPLWQWDNCRKNGCRTLEIIGNIHDNPEMIGGDSG